MTNSQSPIPTTVVTGFLGAGKTTIISHLIEDLIDKGVKVAYLKNEIGAEDLDAKLMAGQNIIARELLNGCICCTLVGPFMAAIDELADTYQLDRIIIETAGTADPASMAISVSNHPRLIRDGVISVVDVVNFDGFEDLSTVARRQSELTDLIVFNKIELVDDERKRQVVGYVRELNEVAPIVEARAGRLSPELAFGLGSGDLSNWVEDSHHSSDHEDQDQASAFTLVSQSEFDENELSQIIASKLPKKVIRIKGVVRLRSGWKVINSVFRRAQFQDLPAGFKEPTQSRLIVIGFALNDDDESELAQLLLSSALPDATPSNKRPLGS